MPPPRRTKVAIIGGGCAAMAAAWDLTSPENKNACDVTIFQMGGRLGGKGASSRNVDQGNRIEEHGLHLWLGYYENAFRMVRSCFSELKTLARGPIADRELQPLVRSRPFDGWNWLSAFERASLVGLADDSSGDWVPWIARFPEYVHRSENGVTGIYEAEDGTTLPGVHVVTDKRRAYPGEPPVLKHGDECEDGEDVCLEKIDVAFFLTHALRELQAFIESLESRIEQATVLNPPPHLSDDPEELLAAMLGAAPAVPEGPADTLHILRLLRLALLAPTIQAFAGVAGIAEGPLPIVRDRFVTILDRCIDAMRERIELIVQGDTTARRIWELIDLLCANIRGLIVSGLQGHDDFSSLDQWNYVDWLRMNRLSSRTLRNPIVRGAHDLGFAYGGGNPRVPQIAAGQAINAGCRFFFMYKGSLFWRMKAGMGDVVFAPMYLALRHRGVKFRFFHRLDDIVLGPDRKTVIELTFRRQVRTKKSDPDAPTNYEPLVVAKGRHPMPMWLVEPDANQFDWDTATRREYDDAMAGKGGRPAVDFESTWCDGVNGERVFVTVGTGKPNANSASIGHFDSVIVTVPVAGLKRVSHKLGAAPNDAGRRWRAMLDNIGTVATQSVQLWVTATTRQLGWKHGQVSFSAFVHPFDTWADLSNLLEVEGQPEARGVHYFCSVIPEDQLPAALRLNSRSPVTADDLAAARQMVRDNARRFLDDWMFQLWPFAAHRYPNAFKWELLVDSPERSGPERLNGQHLVANVDPSERYTQSLPGTTQYRIRADRTGFGNLYIAGDWTDCGLNFGCVEAAVISGRLASWAITRFPDIRLIPGYSESVRSGNARRQPHGAAGGR